MTSPVPVTPHGALPFAEDLVPWNELGLVEVEAGVFEDTFDNRQALSQAGYDYEYLSDKAHADQDLIRVVDSDEKMRRRRGQHSRYRDLLEHPALINSDYTKPSELAHNADIPHWVRQMGRRWNTAVKKGFDPAEHGAWLPTRCRYVRRDGVRCWLWSGTSAIQHETGYCRVHNLKELNVTRDETLNRARTRIWQAAPDMVAVLERLAISAEAEPVRLKAATELLDRAGIRGGTELDVKAEVTHNDAASQIRERLQKLGAMPVPSFEPGGVNAGRTIAGEIEQAPVPADANAEEPTYTTTVAGDVDTDD